MDKAPETRPSRKSRMGTVVSDKMDKTITVRIVRLLKHPRYQRVIRRSSRIMVHDGQNLAGIGDRVKVMETRPFSKNKRWRLVEVLEKAK